MRRRAKRRALPDPVAEWRASRDARGRWTVVNLSGEPVLRTGSAEDVLRAAWLAAAAPVLYDALDRLSGRFSRLVDDRFMTYTRDAALARDARAALVVAHPPLAEVERARLDARQLELDLAEDRAA